MPVDSSSRYAKVGTIEVELPDGSRRTLGVPRVVPRPPTRGVYAVKAGDRIDLLAFAATGDSTKWWILADANHWADATRLERAGETVELPDV